MTNACSYSPGPILAAVGLAFLAACSQTTQTAGSPVATAPAPRPGVAIVAPYAPPAPMPERVPPKPAGPDDGYFVWNPGHYHWNSASPSGSGFAWMGGHFVERPWAGSAWTNGGWSNVNGQWGWTPGYWQ